MPPRESIDSAPGAARPAASPERRRRTPRRLAIAFSIFLLLLVSLRVAGPALIRWAVEDQSPTWMHGRIELEDVDLFVLRGRVEIRGIAVYSSAAPEAALFRVGRLAGDIGWGALLRGQVQIDEVLLEEPEVDLTIAADGRLNWEALLPDAEPEEEEPGEDVSEASHVSEASRWVVHLDHARVVDASVLFRDEREGAISPLEAELGSFRISGLDLVNARAAGESEASLHWELAELDITEWNLDLTSTDGSQLHLVMALHSETLSAGERNFPVTVVLDSDAGHIRLEAQVAASPVSLEAKLEWSALDLSRLIAFAPVDGVSLASASSDGALEISLRTEPEDAMALAIEGGVSLNELDLALAGATAVEVKWPTLEIELSRLAVSPIGAPPDRPQRSEIEISKLVLEKPRIELVLASRAKEAPAAADEDAPTERVVTDAEPDPTGSEPPIALRVAELQVNDASLRLQDHGLAPPFKYTVGQIQLAARDFAWPANTVRNLDLQMAVGGPRPATLKGELGPGEGKFHMVLSEVPLLPFNPYLKRAEVLITQGTLSVTSQVALEGANYDSATEVVVASLSGQSTGDSFASRYGVPLEVAIALLEDPFGKIALSVPLKGSADGGELQLTQATVTALRRSLTNVLATPVSLLATAALPGGDEGRLTFTLVPFSAGDASLSNFASDQLENYAHLLSGGSRFHANLRPQLSVGDARRAAPSASWNADASAEQVDPSHRGYATLLALAEARAAAVVSRLTTNFAVPGERIQVAAWDGRLVEGPAGLRIGFSDGQLD